MRSSLRNRLYRVCFLQLLSATESRRENPMDHHVRISPDWAGEVSIDWYIQSVMSPAVGLACSNILRVLHWNRGHHRQHLKNIGDVKKVPELRYASYVVSSASGLSAQHPTRLSSQAKQFSPLRERLPHETLDVGGIFSFEVVISLCGSTSA